MTDDDHDTETSIPLPDELQKYSPDPLAQVAFELCDLLSRTIVLCPSYNGLESHTATCLEWMRGLGARILHTTRCPDIGLHRSLLATLAYKTMLQEQSYDARDFVLWIDADISISQEELRLLFADQAALATCFPDLAPAVSARYLAKIADRLAAKREPRPVVKHEDKDYVPVLSGMGCLLMTRRAFTEHLRACPAGRDPSNELVYYVCSPGVRIVNAQAQWIGDDWSFCVAHWLHCAGVYLSSARARHSRQILVMPPVEMSVTEQEETPLTAATEQLTLEPRKNT